MLPEEDAGQNRRPSGAARAVRKWGPFAAIMVAVAVLAAMVVLDGSAEEPSAAVGETLSDDADVTQGSGAPPPTGEMPITYAEAEQSGTVGDYDWGANCDTDLGTIKVPSLYATPCVPVFDGGNGGTTSVGVTADSVKVVWYDASESGGLDALLGDAGLNDTAEQQLATLKDWVELYSSLSETYGREVELVRFRATGGMDDAVASQADAERIAQDIGPFAVLGGPPNDGGAFAGELARNNIVCLGCSLGIPECKVLDSAPYLWGTEPATSQFVAGLTAWLTPGDGNKGLSGNAEYAGDPELASRERRFGVIYFDQDPPVMTTCPGGSAWPDDYIAENYILDFATMPQRGSEIVAKMKSAGVTTIIYAGDPLMPVYLTNAAEAIDYHPEWIFSGTVLTDTNTFGRLYDQNQMAHAFGVSQTGVPADSDVGGALVLYRWYFGEDSYPDARAGYAVLQANIPRLLRGIQMAGPDLTPETFELGQFRIPPSGGDPVNPQQSHGNWGFFENSDYNGVDDLAEIWWDPTAEGPDETDKMGMGMWRYARNGARFTPDDPPDPAPFVLEDTVTRYEELPPEAEPPDYPPPQGSPAAGG